MGNVVRISIFKRQDMITIGGKRYAVLYPDELAVHREKNAWRVIEMLQDGKPLEEIQKMICPNCLELTGEHCDCMTKI